jgi:hypothetical protein
VQESLKIQGSFTAVSRNSFHCCQPVMLSFRGLCIAFDIIPNSLSPLSAGIRFIAANVSRCGLCSNFDIVPSVYDAAVVPRVGLNLPSCLRLTISCIDGHRTSCPRYARTTANPRVSPPLAGIRSIAVMLPLIPSVYNAVVVPWAGLNPMSCFALPYAASCISEQPTMPSPTGSYCIPRRLPGPH